MGLSPVGNPLARLACSCALVVGIASEGTLAGGQEPSAAGDVPWAELSRMQPGMSRADALGAALSSGSAHLPEGHWASLLQISYEAFLEELERYASAPARQVAEAMYLASPAVWSCLCVEGSARRMGDLPRAAEVLAATLTWVSDRSARLELRERRSIVAAGAGWKSDELDWLGRGLAMGGTDSLQMRARLALAARRFDRARTLFRVLVDRGRGSRPTLADAAPWALRGWGLALLPTAHEASGAADIP